MLSLEVVLCKQRHKQTQESWLSKLVNLYIHLRCAPWSTYTNPFIFL